MLWVVWKHALVLWTKLVLENIIQRPNKTTPTLLHKKHMPLAWLLALIVWSEICSSMSSSKGMWNSGETVESVVWLGPSASGRWSDSVYLHTCCYIGAFEVAFTLFVWGLQTMYHYRWYTASFSSPVLNTSLPVSKMLPLGKAQCSYHCPLARCNFTNTQVGDVNSFSQPVLGAHFITVSRLGPPYMSHVEFAWRSTYNIMYELAQLTTTWLALCVLTGWPSGVILAALTIDLEAW